MVVTLGQQYNIGEKPTVILYTYINRHAGTPTKGNSLTLLGQQFDVGEKPTVILQQLCTLTLLLVAMQGHQRNHSGLHPVPFLSYSSRQRNEFFRGHKLTQNKVQKNNGKWTKVGIPTPFSDKVGGGKMQTSSPPVITPNRSQSNPDDMITLPRPIQSVGMNLHDVSGTSTGQTLPRERRAPPGTHLFCPTIWWVYPPSATIFILHPLLSEIYSLLTTLIHILFRPQRRLFPPHRQCFPVNQESFGVSIPDGTTTRETGSNCSCSMHTVHLDQENSFLDLL